MVGWIDLVIVLLLLLLASESIKGNGWSAKYIKWTKLDNDNQYKLKLCTSNGEELLCGNFTWSYPSCNSERSDDDTCISKYECRKENSSHGNSMQCYVEYFYCQL